MTSQLTAPAYRFSTPWFDNTARSVWENMVPQISPKRILEVGSYEGASACFLIETLAPHHPIELHCIDTWQGGIEHQPGREAPANMNAVEQQFRKNMEIALSRYPGQVALQIHKGCSIDLLSGLIASGRKGKFDFVYIDGSHQAADVLADAVLGFELLAVGGVIVFDDYLWAENLPSGIDPLQCPKLAVDAFTNINARKLKILTAPLYQLFCQKIAD